jgi:hypothetical protein
MPVTMLPVAHYSGINNGGDSGTFGWYPRGSSTLFALYHFAGGISTGQANGGYGENQKLFPVPTPATTTFSPSGAFGIWESEGARSDDALDGGVHDIRFFPAKGAAGAMIPGAYLVAMDPGPPTESGTNWDYQDGVFLLRNVQPAG